MAIRSIVLGLALGVLAGGQGVRELDIKGHKLGEAKGQVDKPVVIANMDELKKAVDDPATVNKVAGQVDFAKDKVLYFKWSGSGQDKLEAKAEKTSAGGEVVGFTFNTGKTLDLRQHHHMFGIPKDATWKVERVNPIGKIGPTPTALPAHGKQAIRAVNIKDLRLGEAQGAIGKPVVISTGEELATVIADKEALAKIREQIDFGQEMVLYFKWGGSGGDMLSFVNDQKTGVMFTYTRGLTRDLRPHHGLFVLPKGTAWALNVK